MSEIQTPSNAPSVAQSTPNSSPQLWGIRAALAASLLNSAACEAEQAFVDLVDAERCMDVAAQNNYQAYDGGYRIEPYSDEPLLFTGEEDMRLSVDISSRNGVFEVTPDLKQFAVITGCADDSLRNTANTVVTPLQLADPDGLNLQTVDAREIVSDITPNGDAWNCSPLNLAVFERNFGDRDESCESTAYFVGGIDLVAEDWEEAR